MAQEVYELSAEKAEEAIEFYQKLYKSLKLALADEKLGCHVNIIILEMAKSIESQYTYFNPNMDVWCDYFIHGNSRNNPPEKASEEENQQEGSVQTRRTMQVRR